MVGGTTAEAVVAVVVVVVVTMAGAVATAVAGIPGQVRARFKGGELAGFDRFRTLGLSVFSCIGFSMVRYKYGCSPFDLAYIPKLKAPSSTCNIKASLQYICCWIP